MWKRLKHKNVVLFLGITPTPLQVISKWMSSENLTEYIKKHPDANRRLLVGAPVDVSDLGLTPPLAL